jgi:hypothetical protein
MEIIIIDLGYLLRNDDKRWVGLKICDRVILKAN